MKKRKLLENLEVEDMVAEGQGISRYEGKVIFIDGGIPGDIADVEIYKNKKDYALARYTRIKHYSEKRAEPFCRHFWDCGGCKWQHLEYPFQLEFKQQIVEDAFRRIAKVEIPNILPILASPKTRHYRNKLEFTFSDKRWLTRDEIGSGHEFPHKNALGYHISGAFDKVLDIEECWLQDNIQNLIRNAVRDFALENGFSFYNLREHTGLLRNLIIRLTTTGELMVIMIFAENNQEKIEQMMGFLRNKFRQVTSLLYVVNQKKNDTIFDQQIVRFSGKDYILEKLGDYQFKIGAKSFFQTNSYQARHLYESAIELSGIQPADVVYDLYTGTGSIGIYVSGKCKKVVGIEQIPEAIEDAWFNARLNKVENIDFHAGDMKDILKPEFIEQNEKPDIIITDPPRAGMHPDVVDVILRSGARKIIYVSCNAATQARDVKMLEPGYRLELIQPVDMFPHTFHVENIAVLSKVVE